MVPWSRKSKALVYAVAGAAAVAMLAALHAAESAAAVGAVEVNRLLNVAAAWLAAGGLLITGSGLSRGARPVWLWLAAGAAALAVGDAVVAYYVVVRRAMPRALWVVNFLYLAGYLVITAALLIKAKSLPWSWRPLVRLAAVAVVGAAFVVWLYSSFRVLISQPAVPAVVKFFVAAFPLADFAMVALAVYIFTTFGRGVAGRPWMAITVGVLAIALSDLAGSLYASWPAAMVVLRPGALVAQFAGYAAIAWGAWYHRAILKES
ncbi:MAG: hypothetical protein JSU81_04610 [Candidatus Coatesbacteria bacterium]|nr:MAG: hypothetical protein JSU81_04610 [Candidatus Coatesbacteria bacterium]